MTSSLTSFVRIIICLTIVLALVIALTWIGWLRVKKPGFLSKLPVPERLFGPVIQRRPFSQLSWAC